MKHKEPNGLDLFAGGLVYSAGGPPADKASSFNFFLSVFFMSEGRVLPSEAV